jgi:hypothetical protein
MKYLLNVVDQCHGKAGGDIDSHSDDECVPRKGHGAPQLLQLLPRKAAVRSSGARSEKLRNYAVAHVRRFSKWK